MFSRYKISTQMLLGYSIALTMLAVITIIVYFNVSQILETYKWVDRTHLVIEKCYELQHLITEMESGERGFTILGSSEFLDIYHRSADQFEKESRVLLKLLAHNPEQTAKLNRFCNAVRKWQRESAMPVIKKRKEINQLPETEILATMAKLLGAESGKLIIHNHDIHSLFEEFVGVENALMEVRRKTAEKSVRNTINFMVFGTLFSIILGLIIAFFLSKSISTPINKIVQILKKIIKGEMDINKKIEIDMMDRIQFNNELGQLTYVCRELTDFIKETTQIADAIARGDLTPQLTPRGPHDILARSINQMIDNFQSVISQANRIAEGDLSIDVSVHSDKDVLGNTLNIMTLALRNSREENQQQDWLKSGQTQLNDIMRGEHDIPALCSHVINFVADYMDCQMGALYILDEKEHQLKLISSYAFERRKGLANRFALGESLVGQAALEKQPFVINEIPKDYVRVSSGLGASLPTNIMIYPLLLNNQVKGIIELGSFSKISDIDLEWMKSISETIAIAIHSAQSRERLQVLLKQTQNQSEQLQEQQEELRQSNEELEERTQVLQESQAKLQTQQEEMEVQQEELRQSNETLEQQKSLLEAQKSSIEEKNLELERAHQLIQDKVREVESASRYKSEFMANMSHELRTPLNSIILLSRLLADNKYGNLSEKQAKFAETVHSCGNDLLDLINEILDLAKVESGKMELHPQDVHLKMIAQKMVQLFRPTSIEKKITFNVTVAESLPMLIHTDIQKSEQVIKNLLSNAFKFTAKGEVHLKIDWAYNCPNVPQHINAEKSIAFQIIDTGEGIPDEKKSIIFEAFRQANGTTKRKYGGTGLGLSIAREFARILGGDIHLTSVYGQGSTFTLFLPLRFEGETLIDRNHKAVNSDRMMTKNIQTSNISEQPKTEKEITQSEQQASKKEIPPTIESIKPNSPESDPDETNPDDDRVTSEAKTLLIIEDDQNFAMYLNEMASEKGFETMIAADGETGLEYAQEFKPDAIFLDVMLPGMDGWTVLEKLKSNEALRHIPVHFITCATPERQKEALKKGAIGYLAKPVDKKALDGIFQHIEVYISKTIKNLLVAINDEALCMSVVESISDADVLTAAVHTANEAYDMLVSATFDCIILDVDLPDMTGIQLLEKIRNTPDIRQVPVIIFTNKTLSPDESEALEEYAQRIIYNESGSASFDRLMDESKLFLHQVKTRLPQKTVSSDRVSHDRDAMFKDKNILMVDDDMRNVFAVSSVLEEKGMNIIVAENGRDALKQLEENSHIDLIIMDMMMPEMDGYEAMRAIRKTKKFQDVIILALTAKAMRGDRDRCIEAGANDYMSKPVEPDKLLSMLRVWLYN